MSVVFDNPVQPVLSLPPNVALWQHCKSLFESVSDPAVGWRIYLHQLAWTALQPWFREEGHQPVTIWPSVDPVEIWRWVDGLALTLGPRRILVVLSEGVTATSLHIPQEWVDSPNWAVDYYLAAYVDIDAQRLVLWGYTPYAQVKQRGQYEPSDRTYILDDTALIQDFAAFWVAQQLERPQPISIPALPPLSDTQAENLIGQLANAIAPRLAILPQQWAALLSNDRWRQQLGQIGTPQRSPVDLEYWLEQSFQQAFQQGWRSLESLLAPPPTLAFRSATSNNAIPLANRGNETIISRGKVIPLDTRGRAVILVLRIGRAEGDMGNAQVNQRRSIRIQLFPVTPGLLPSSVTLTLDLPETGEQLQQVQSGTQDNYIQIPTFCCPVGHSFRVKVGIGDTLAQEDFVS